MASPRAPVVIGLEESAASENAEAFFAAFAARDDVPDVTTLAVSEAFDLIFDADGAVDDVDASEDDGDASDDDGDASDDELLDSW